MTAQQITEEVLRYLNDDSYQYAILIDGEWGCGKTYYVQEILTKEIEKVDTRKIKYISLYGCKTVQDIQEDIVWSLTDDAKKKIHERLGTEPKGTRIGNKVFLSTKRIVSGLAQHFDFDTKVYNIISDWLEIKSYIFVFDDIERCDCPINEVFGYINGLVEHENAKVILVANEREIAVKASTENIASQYAVALSDQINWPPKQSLLGVPIREPQGKIDFEELERRRNLLFPSEEYDGVYRKIREKLIGVTLVYEPDMRSIFEALIKKSAMSEDVKQILIDGLGTIKSTLDTYGHHNLRTFQFFLSKAKYLCEKAQNIEELKEEYKEGALVFIIYDCLIWAVMFKGNYQPPTDLFRKAEYESRKKSQSIELYVRTGEFEEDFFKREMLGYIEEELINKLQNDDPLFLLSNQYYFHKQEWCEEQIQYIMERLKENRYTISQYVTVLIALARLIELGFSADYLTNAKELMLSNIPNMQTVYKINLGAYNHLHSSIREMIQPIVVELNNAIIGQDEKLKYSSISGILMQENWVDLLEEYSGVKHSGFVPNKMVFSAAPAQLWLEAICGSMPDNLDLFRRWLGRQYPCDFVRSELIDDIRIIQEVQ